MSLMDPTPTATSPRRLPLGLAAAVVLPGMLTLVLLGVQPAPSLGLITPLYLLVAVGVALLGGLIPAVVAALLGSLLANWFFVPPLGTLVVGDPAHVGELVVSLVVASIVALLVSANERRTSAALAAQREATALSEVSQVLLGSTDQLGALLQRAVAAFGVRAAAIERRSSREVVSATEGFEASAKDADRTPAGPAHILVLQPGGLDPSAKRLFDAYAVHAAAILHRRELEASAATAEALARDNRARTALLSAVSHDLRTPLAGIKAAIGSLRSPDVTWTPDEQRELMAAIEGSSDRLEALIDNLLDLSRLQAGALVAHPRAVDLGEILPALVRGLSRPEQAAWTLDDGARFATADPGLLERVLGNVAENALRVQPDAAGPVALRAARRGERVEIAVTDRGPGVPASQLDRIFQPFQRYGDSPDGEGTGLGLAVARGLAEAMGGTLRAELPTDGGLAMIVSLPAASTPERGA